MNVSGDVGWWCFNEEFAGPFASEESCSLGILFL